MELDELKAAWAAQGARLEQCVVVQESLLRERTRRALRFTLAPFAFWRLVECAIGVALLAALLPVVIGQLERPRYLLIGMATVGYVAVATVQCLGLLLGSLRLGADRPVVELQEALERMRLAEFRCLRFVLLGGVAAWLPLAVLLLESISGAPLLDALANSPLLAQLPLGWLAANVLLGVALLAGGWLWSRRRLERGDLSPFARRLRDALTSAPLHRAHRHLAELAGFTRDEAPSTGDATG